MQLPVQPLGEGELLVVGEGLIVEDQDGVFVHSGPEPGQRLGIMDLSEVDRAHLSHEMGVKLPECQRHGHEPRASPGRESSRSYDFLSML